ncbi:hypothetical protein CW362_00255 [Streptomyces populi]|uniref:Uncharacterized protein n=1 Tax=Streptomyces populi TaxID=2058924 RepID=A0A2I0SY61_9ACTN|nr:hypothetical protein CW362_00255 [Streptomyces populi]
MLPDLSAVPPWAAVCLIALTTVTTTLVTLVRAVVRTLPQTAPARLEWWREVLRYRLTVRELKDARRTNRRSARNAPVSSSDTESVRTGDGPRESAGP